MTEQAKHDVLIRDWFVDGQYFAAAICATPDCGWVAHRAPGGANPVSLAKLAGEHVKATSQPPPKPVMVGDYPMGTEPMADFVLARVAEDERPCVCTENGNGACGAGWCRQDCRPCSGGDALTSDEYVLAICGAIRAMVGGYRHYGGAADAWWSAVCSLATIWADHPDHPDRKPR